MKLIYEVAYKLLLGGLYTSNTTYLGKYLIHIWRYTLFGTSPPFPNFITSLLNRLCHTTYITLYHLGNISPW